MYLTSTVRDGLSTLITVVLGRRVPDRRRLRAGTPAVLEIHAAAARRDASFFLGASGRCLGEVALAQGDAEEAVRRLEAAIETLRASGSENELGLALGALGRAKRLVGNELEATASAREALAILDRLGTLEEPDRLRYELVAEPV